MEKNYQFLDIEINKTIHRKLTAMQYDNNSRYILVSVYSNFKPYDLTYATVKIYGGKKDKTVFFNNAKILDAKAGKFEIDLTEQCLAVDGDVEIQILILGANQERLSSNSFILNVKKTLIDPGRITSQDEWGVLTEGLSNLAEYDIYKNNVERHDKEINNKLIDFVTLEDFGGVADAKYFDPATNEWYTDETKEKLATDNTDSLKNALKSIYSSKSFKLKIMGHYCIRGEKISVPCSSIQIKGSGINTSSLCFTNPKSGIVFESPDDYIYEIHIKDLGLHGSNVCENILKFSRCEQSSLENVSISNSKKAVIFDRFALSKVNRFTLLDNMSGIEVNNCGNLHLDSCNLWNTTEDVFAFKGNNGILTFTNSHIEKFGNIVKIEGQTQVTKLVINSNNILSVEGGTLLKTSFSQLDIPNVSIIFTENRINLLNTNNYCNINCPIGVYGSLIELIFKNNTYVNLSNFKFLVNSNLDKQSLLIVNADDNLIDNNKILNGGGTVCGFQTWYGRNVIDNGFYPTKDKLEGHLKYDFNIKRLTLRENETYKYNIIPVQAGWISESSATTIEDLVSDFNKLIRLLKESKCISS